MELGRQVPDGDDRASLHIHSDMSLRRAHICYVYSGAHRKTNRYPNLVKFNNISKWIGELETASWPDTNTTTTTTLSMNDCIIVKHINSRGDFYIGISHDRSPRKIPMQKISRDTKLIPSDQRVIYFDTKQLSKL